MEVPDVVTVRKCADTSYAKYLHSKNIIELHNIQEQQLPSLLIHELNHWAQQLYLTQEEQHYVEQQYQHELEQHRLPFIESMLIGLDSYQEVESSRVNKGLRFYL